MLFFLLSGFLMAYLHLDQPFTAHNLYNYILKRFARVYPLFLIVASIPLMLFLAGVPDKTPMSSINSFTIYLRQITLIDHGKGTFWTIRVEIFFYIAFIMIWAIHRTTCNRMVTLTALMVGICFLRYNEYNFTTEVFRYIHYFLFGVVSAILYQHRQASAGITLSVFAALVFVSVPLTYPQIFLYVFGVTLSPWKSDIVAVQIVSLFNLVLRERRWLSAILISRVGRWLGKVSYSTYLLHHFVLAAVLSWIGPESGQGIRLGLCLTVIVMVSEASNRWIERPLQHFVLTQGDWAGRPHLNMRLDNFTTLPFRLPVWARSYLRGAGARTARLGRRR